MEENNDPQQNNAIAGLSRIAYGKINDAVRLLVKNPAPDSDVISQLDLFGVSEIKQNKDGGLDIKFYDRLKALELLLAAGEQEAPLAASSFFGALESAAKTVCDTDDI